MQTFDRCQVPADGVRGQALREVASKRTLLGNIAHERRALSENAEKISAHFTESYSTYSLVVPSAAFVETAGLVSSPR